LGVVQKSGAWYSYGSERIGQGRDNVREFLKDNAATVAAIETQIRGKLGLPGGAESGESAESGKAGGKTAATAKAPVAAAAAEGS